jgi:hypothetical protein
MGRGRVFLFPFPLANRASLLCSWTWNCHFVFGLPNRRFALGVYRSADRSKDLAIGLEYRAIIFQTLPFFFQISTR